MLTDHLHQLAHQPGEIGVGRVRRAERRHGPLDRGLLGDFPSDHLITVRNDLSGFRIDDFLLNRRVPEQLNNDIFRQLVLLCRRGCPVVTLKQFFDLVVVVRQNVYDVAFGHCRTSPGRLSG